MKFYTLNAIVKGEPVKIEKMFNTRNDAINYMFKYYDNHFIYGLEVQEEVSVDGDKHNVEYICDHNDRFRVNRVVL